MSETEIWTIKALLEWTTSFLKSKGSESPRLEAEVLLAFASGKSRVDLYVCYDEEPNETVRAAFRDLVRRRGRGEPVAYLVGKKEFYSLDFKVDRRVLIPRPETEQLVLETVEFVKKRDKVFGKADKERAASSEVGRTWRFCDVGTGSGCLAVALAKNVANCSVTALDLSEEALEVARENAAAHSTSDRVAFVRSDLFDALRSQKDALFDVVVSNPPYVSDEEYAALEPTVRLYEPKIALLGGPTGAELPIELVRQAPDFLARGGRIFLELSPTTVAPTLDALREDSRWENATAFADYSRVMRYVVATKK